MSIGRLAMLTARQVGARRHGRLTIAGVVFAGVVLAGSAGVSGTGLANVAADRPAVLAFAAPAARQHGHSIRAVERRLNSLHRQAEIAAERANTVRVKMQDARAHLQGLQRQLGRERRRIDTLHRALVNAVLTDYQTTSGLSTAATFLSAHNPTAYLNSLATNAIVEHQQAGLLMAMHRLQRQLSVQKRQAAHEVAAIEHDQRQLAQQRTRLRHKVGQARALLDHLKAQKRARLRRLQAEQATATTTTRVSRDESRPALSGTAPVSAQAQIAVSTALAQVGKPYSYGAAGPDSFDCSGLTMYAWAAAGVSLPHSSSLQASAGTPVSLSSLQPGDLVFFYSVDQHVGIYIGNGEVVHAPQPGESVQVAPVTSMPAVYAVRVR